MSWYYENKVEWYDYMQNVGCGSHIWLLLLHLKIVCNYNIKLQTKKVIILDDSWHKLV